MADRHATDVIDGLRATLAGQVITERDPDYQSARRVWNGMIDRRPLAVVRPASVTEMPAVIGAAVRAGLPLAVRGGGHNVAGNGTVDDGIVLDLGGLDKVDVDAGRRLVRVEPGATLADVDRATEPAGLVVPMGVVSATGVAGLTLGGGFGWLTRPYGLTVDSLVSADVITADGRILTASESENADLFWGLRGGGGNFGVVTSFTFRAQSLGPQVFAGNLFYREDKWAAALRAYGDWTLDLPDPLTSIVTVLIPPPAWELGTERLMFIGFTWAGEDWATAEALVDRLRQSAPPDIEAVEPARWVDWQSQADELFPPGVRAYWKNVAFDHLSPDVVATVVEHVAQLPTDAAIDIHHMEGAFARVPEDATAFPSRDARYWLNIYSYWREREEDGANIARIRDFHAAMEPHARPGQYVNFLGNEGRRANQRELALAAYGPAKFERLVSLKREYDPHNVFRLNHNIPVA